ASWMGIVFCLLSLFSIVLLVLWRVLELRLFGMNPNDQLGWTSIIVLILFLSGVQLLTIGLLGEYIAVLVEEVKARQPWIIDRAQGFDEEGPGSLGWFVASNTRPPEAP
ncbi:MAG: hypothetical protein P1V97_22605, partial [Planctomycetota bacterium]|nr:hypothetical protein [Planctomycetota bacterium]